MDEIWERAVETALVGETEPLSARILTLDGAVKCVGGHLPRREVLEKFENLEHLSIASIGVSSLDRFPRLGKLQKLVLSDNRISGGLEFLVEAGLGSLRDLDLSNNRIQSIDELVPLAQLKLVSLDLYECPVTRMKDYRSRVFGLVKSLKYLDKMDAEENERPESEDEEDDDEEGEEEEEDEEEDEDDPGSCEIDGEERLLPNVMSNGHSESRLQGVVEADEEESEADEEEAETGRQSNGVANGLHLNMEDDDEDDEEDGEYEDDGLIVGDDEEDVGEGEEEVDNDEDGEDEFEDDGLIVGDDDEEDVGEGEEEVDNDEGNPPRNLLQREGELDGDEGVVDAIRLSNRINHVTANGSQNVLLNVDDEDSDEEDEHEDDVGDTEDNDLGVPHRNELLRNMMIDGHELDEDDNDNESEEEEEEEEEDGVEEVREMMIYLVDVFLCVL